MALTQLSPVLHYSTPKGRLGNDRIYRPASRYFYVVGLTDLVTSQELCIRLPSLLSASCRYGPTIRAVNQIWNVPASEREQRCMFVCKMHEYASCMVFFIKLKEGRAMVILKMGLWVGHHCHFSRLFTANPRQLGRT